MDRIAADYDPQPLLDGLSESEKYTLATRAVIRVVRNFSPFPGRRTSRELLVLLTFRSLLCAGLKGKAYEEVPEWLEKKTGAARAFDQAIGETSKSNWQSARHVALAAKHAALGNFAEALEDVGNSLHFISPDFSATTMDRDNPERVFERDRAARRLAFSRTAADLKKDAERVSFETPIEIGEKDAEGTEALFMPFYQTLSRDGENWARMSGWLSEMLAGSFSGWEFALKVAKIDDDIWDQGPQAVADEIERLKREHSGGDGAVTPEDVLEENVAAQFQRSALVQASMGNVAEVIEQRVALFQELDRPNEMVAIQACLEGIASASRAIAVTVEKGPSADGATVTLALENGRLRAQVEQLKAELAAAHKELETFRKKPWYRSASVLLSGSMVGALAAGLWTLSGDDRSLEDRWNKLAADLEFLRGEIWCEPEDRIDPPYRFALPEVREA